MTQTLGDLLKQKRGERDLSLEEVSKVLHIQIKYLDALENDNFDLIPSQVQARGFARLYADFLEINNINPLLKSPHPNLPTEETPAYPDLSSTSTTDHQPQIVENSGIEEPPLQDATTLTTGLEEDSVLQSQVDNNNIASSDLFKAIGNKLYERRETLGISLEEVERHTHLKTFYLKSLEEGNFHKLPSPVQGKGMLTNYAHFLDLDNEQILLLYADALQARREELVNQNASGSSKPPVKKQAPTRPSSLKRFITPDLLIGSGVILLIFFFSLWAISAINSQRNATLDSPPPPISDVLSNQPIFDTTLQPIEQLTSTPVAAQQNSQVNTNSDENDELAEETIPTIDNKSLQVYIIASDRAWVRVISDTETVFNGRVLPGNAYPFSADTQLELVTGNAAALQVFFNQQDLGTLGVFGEVASLVFNSEGVLTPTPIFTPTYTATIPPTLTPLPSPTIPSPTVTPFNP